MVTHCVLHPTHGPGPLGAPPPTGWSIIAFVLLRRISNPLLHYHLHATYPTSSPLSTVDPAAVPGVAELAAVVVGPSAGVVRGVSGVVGVGPGILLAELVGGCCGTSRLAGSATWTAHWTVSSTIR